MTFGSRRPSPASNASAHDSALQLVGYWGTVVVWMAVITLLSGEPFSAANTNRYLDPVLRLLFPHLTPAGFVTAHTVVRKTAHFLEFFVLGSLGYWASRRAREPRWRRRWMLQALGLAVLYSLVDEAHQAFIPNRTASPLDSAVDSLGAAFSQAIIYLRARLSARRITQESQRAQSTRVAGTGSR